MTAAIVAAAVALEAAIATLPLCTRSRRFDTAVAARSEYPLRSSALGERQHAGGPNDALEEAAQLNRPRHLLKLRHVIVSLCHVAV